MDPHYVSVLGLDYIQEMDYSQRVPTPPRINVPPPGMLSDDHQNMLQFKLANSDPETETMNFLKAYNYFNLPRAEAPQNWQYESRRIAQCILPFLFLGPRNAAADKDFLVREGITMVLAIRGAFSKKSMIYKREFEASEELGIHKDMVDAGTAQELIASLPGAVTSINTHLRQAHYSLPNGSRFHDDGTPRGGKILVFCETGNDRSAAVAVAYIMTTFADIGLIEAIQHVQTRRFCISVNDEMKQMLFSYEDILRARRDVAASRQSTPMPTAQAFQNGQDGNGTGRLKRVFDDSMDDEDDEETGNGDGAMAGGRGVAPFRDLT
jgi:serine/threonine/tyrosine-interacting protein